MLPSHRMAQDSQMGPQPSRRFENTSEHWFLLRGESSDEVNPGRSLTLSSSGCHIDSILFESILATTLERYGHWPSKCSRSHGSIVNNKDEETGGWKPVAKNLLQFEQIVKAINDSGPGFVPKYPFLTAPVNALPRWVGNQLMQYCKFIVPNSVHRKQLKEVHSEWFPISYDDYYYDGIAPSAENILMMQTDYPDGVYIPPPPGSSRQPVTEKDAINRAFYDYRTISSCAAIIPAGTYTVDYNNESDLEQPEFILPEISRKVWNGGDSEYPVGTMFNGARELKKITLEEDLVVGFVCARMGEADNALVDPADLSSLVDFVKSKDQSIMTSDDVFDTNAYIMSVGVIIQLTSLHF
eukprot:GHVH01005423.1.p1 GENE.GHVH01005423.1~~GHVH01005423.1.p1  ORF type:complete len:354 (-),score=48.67 GHVH01005423.1:551-1612(-)